MNRLLNILLFSHSLSLPTPTTELPKSWDWRDYGAVSPVKNQGQCGSCWTFSSVGAIESAYAIATNTTALSLSEQEIVDCASKDGCSGGIMDHAFEWVERHNGLCSEEDYPYQAVDGECKKCEPVVRVRDYVDVPPNDPHALLRAVLQQPVAIAIQADQYAFQLYTGGVLRGTCGTNLNHGCVIVGFGEEDGVPYWIVKNSWGDWGEDGYVRIYRSMKSGPGMCGINMMPSYPIIDI
jgi:C1A family cysteine protease